MSEKLMRMLQKVTTGKKEEAIVQTFSFLGGYLGLNSGLPT
jgi:hypothetical protein